MSKKDYRVRNWKDYNEALVQRGSITFWFSEEAIKDWQVSRETGKRGRPEDYSDVAISCCLTLKSVFNLTFRGTEGFVKSLISQLGLSLKTPDYTLLCKRQKNLEIVLPKPRRKDEELQLVFDTSGVKVFGEGEWKVRRYGYTKKRLWRKLHLAINIKTQLIEACELTELGTQDCEGFKKLVEAIKDPIEIAIGDGAYDRFSCYEVLEQRGGKGIFPPQHNAVTSDERKANKKKASKEAVAQRDEAVKQVRALGGKEWKRQVGYHRRSLAETGVFRVKTLLGRRLGSRTLPNQRVEARIWCSAINKMTLLGMPKTIAI
jgi:hypothetical protein